MTGFVSQSVPVLKTLTQPEKISEILALFSDAGSSFWQYVTQEVPFQPAQAKQIAGLIKNTDERSQIVRRMARYWLNRDREAMLKGWEIANHIEECSSRADFFIGAFDRLKQANLNLSDAQKARSLDQLEALVNQTVNRTRRSKLQFSLVELNVEHGRKAQGVSLLEQITASLKQEASYLSRARTLVQVAQQYQKLGNKTIAVQMLDAAVIAVDASSTKEMRGNLLRRIATQYRSLDQSEKAIAIEKRVPKQASPEAPEINPPPINPQPPSTVRIRG